MLPDVPKYQTHCPDMRANSRSQAVKIFSKSLLKKRRLGQQSDKFAALQNEIAIMKRLRHPNVIQLHEVIDDPMRDELFVGASGRCTVQVSFP